MSGFPRTEAWAQFLERASSVRNHPRFDAEERDRNLEFAGVVESVLEVAREGGRLDPRLNELSFWLSDPERLYPLITPKDNQWLEDWASRDEASLSQALCAIVSPKQAEAHMAGFLERAEAAYAAGLIERRPRVALAFGSLFNFALAPRSLPVVRVHPFARLETMLGYEPRSTAPLAEQYANHLAFARRLETEMRKSGIPIVDMLDVQALIFLTGLEEFWDWTRHDSAEATGTSESGRAEDQRDGGGPYLSICSCLGYDAPYLLEWIEFHRMVGVERFFLYNNRDRKAQEELLARYVEDGTVVLHDWPVFPPQLPAHRHCLQEHRNASRWIAFIDTDEFLFSPTGHELPTMLSDYEAAPGVGVNQAFFGTSGHSKKPDGLVIENFLQRISSRHIKSIVDPRRATDCVSPHYFLYRCGSAVDENFRRIGGAKTLYTSFSRLRINHYKTKSEEEFRAKLAVPLPDYGQPRELSEVDRSVDLVSRYGRHDDAILEYLPRLRKRLRLVPTRTQPRIAK